jgi:hypothetical protein
LTPALSQTCISAKNFPDGIQQTQSGLADERYEGRLTLQGVSSVLRQGRFATCRLRWHRLPADVPDVIGRDANATLYPQKLSGSFPSRRADEEHSSDGVME